MLADKHLKRDTVKRRARHVFLSVLCVLCVGCGPRVKELSKAPSGLSLREPRLQSQVVNKAELLRVRSVAVAPIELGSRVRSQNEQPVALYDYLSDAARRELGMKVLLLDAAALASAQQSGGLADGTPRGAVPRREAALQQVEQLGGDAILLTKLHHFNQRVGSRVGAEKPAHVSFEMSLVREADQAPIWTASFSFRDQALSDNLFRIGERVEFNRKGQLGWKSADSIAQLGFKEAFEDLSSHRRAQFERAP